MPPLIFCVFYDERDLRNGRFHLGKRFALRRNHQNRPSCVYARGSNAQHVSIAVLFLPRTGRVRSRRSRHSSCKASSDAGWAFRLCHSRSANRLAASCPTLPRWSIASGLGLRAVRAGFPSTLSNDHPEKSIRNYAGCP